MPAGTSKQALIARLLAGILLSACGAASAEVYWIVSDAGEEGDGRLKAIAKLEDGNIVDAGFLGPGQTYVWRVDATRADGSAVKCELWSFTVQGGKE